MGRGPDMFWGFPLHKDTVGRIILADSSCEDAGGPVVLEEDVTDVAGLLLGWCIINDGE